MPTTSNFGWTTPADTDLVKDGAAAIRTLGNGIDTSLVDLKGGTTGQVLSKATNTDLDYTWITPNVGDITEVQAGVGISVASGTGPIPVITNSSTDLITTAGDILYGTAADTMARLGIGTAGQVLKVNSGATAPEWAAATVGFVGASAYKSTPQAITNNTQTAITWENEYFDTDGFHSTVTNTSRFTIPSGKGGKYLFTALGRFAANSTGIRSWTFYKNGASAIATGAMNAASTGGSVQTAVWATSLVAGDYVELFCFQTSGGNLNINSDADESYITVTYLGA